jgi:hypothetical protein
VRRTIQPLLPRQNRNQQSSADVWFTSVSISDNELARRLKHEGLRVGEIIAYRAWQVINPRSYRNCHDRLHSVFIQDYVWHPDEPASGDVRTHGIYSFRRVIRSMAEYGYDPCADGPLLFGKVKIWGEVGEHELGYRSQFGKIVSLDYGNPRLLEKFRKIYRVNQVLPEKYPLEDGRRLI